MHPYKARKQARQKIADFIRDNPEVSYKLISETLGCSLPTVGKLAKQFRVTRYRKPLGVEDLAKLGVK